MWEYSFKMYPLCIVVVLKLPLCVCRVETICSSINTDTDPVCTTSSRIITDPLSLSHSSPLLGYTTQGRSGLLSWLTVSSRGRISAGEQQFTPTATSWLHLWASRTASRNRLPSHSERPSWGGRFRYPGVRVWSHMRWAPVAQEVERVGR